MSLFLLWKFEYCNIASGINELIESEIRLSSNTTIVGLLILGVWSTGGEREGGGGGGEMV